MFSDQPVGTISWTLWLRYVGLAAGFLFGQVVTLIKLSSGSIQYVCFSWASYCKPANDYSRKETRWGVLPKSTR